MEKMQTPQPVLKYQSAFVAMYEARNALPASLPRHVESKNARTANGHPVKTKNFNINTPACDNVISASVLPTFVVTPRTKDQ